MSAERVVRFASRTTLDEAIAGRMQQGFRVARLDADDWLAEEDLHAAFASALDFPAYYGGNLNALNDCLRDVGDRGYGWDERDVGLLIVVDSFHDWDRRAPTLSSHVLDIVDGTAAEAAALGNDIRWYFDDQPD